MITSEQLANLVIMRVIFHDVPSQTRTTNVVPVLSEIDTTIDAGRKGLLKKKLVQALSSRGAYPILFDSNKTATIANQVKEMTANGRDADYVSCSQVMAQELFSKQSGQISPGLLCVIDARVDSQRSVILMKLERHEGAQLKIGESNGKRTYAMQVLDDLVLTEGTRLFKTAIFVRRSSGSQEFEGLACDSQLGVSASAHLAAFWLNFLGCNYVVDPRVATERFFSSTLAFVNASVDDPTTKFDIYEALQSELKSSKLNFSPRRFIEEHVVSNYRVPFQEHLAADGVSLSQFRKDVSNIDRRLKHLRYETAGGAIISVPFNEADLVVINDNTILINDRLTKVK